MNVLSVSYSRRSRHIPAALSEQPECRKRLYRGASSDVALVHNTAPAKLELPMSAGAHLDPSNKKVALTIAVLAVLLAFCETLGKGAQTEALNRNIEAANLWAFFQAKTIRMSLARTAADTAELQLPAASEAARPALQKRIDDWRKTADRYDTEPKEGRKDLAARAGTAEAARDRHLAAYHQYEIASAAIQIAIVLASAEVITGAAFLLWGALGLGVIGLAFGCIGFFAPTAVHLF